MLTDLFNSIILGITEGLTEFLPVSSTGHLILINKWFYFEDSFTKMFDIVIQVGAILAVVFYFWKRLFPFGKFKTLAEKKDIWQLWRKTLVGVIPAIIIGATVGKIIEEKLFNSLVVSLALLIGGLILIYIEGRKHRASLISIKQLSYTTAFLIGLIQCIAMIPGTSRSAATIIGAMLLGTSRQLAVEFSFFLAIPTLIAASGYALLKHGISFSGNEILILAAGFITSFIVALAVVAGLMKFIAKHDLKIFGYYRIILAVIILLIIR
ncbi:MAG: undecaprenyl-diphosphate phosphatase [Candidatus Margulisbacteria bacterium]|nr:undecaprenyl-diphosphate phosphatase [Candidatus Margulisiibacteriota bacterium]